MFAFVYRYGFYIQNTSSVVCSPFCLPLLIGVIRWKSHIPVLLIDSNWQFCALTHLLEFNQWHNIYIYIWMSVCCTSKYSSVSVKVIEPMRCSEREIEFSDNNKIEKQVHHRMRCIDWFLVVWSKHTFPDVSMSC